MVSCLEDEEVSIVGNPVAAPAAVCGRVTTAGSDFGTRVRHVALTCLNEYHFGSSSQTGTFVGCQFVDDVPLEPVWLIERMQNAVLLPVSQDEQDKASKILAPLKILYLLVYFFIRWIIQNVYLEKQSPIDGCIMVPFH